MGPADTGLILFVPQMIGSDGLQRGPSIPSLSKPLSRTPNDWSIPVASG